MIYPTIETLGKGKLDRYSVTIAVAKAARLVTDQYMKEKEEAERIIGSKSTDKCVSSMISEELRDDSSIKVAIDRIENGTYKIVTEDEKKD